MTAAFDPELLTEPAEQQPATAPHHEAIDKSSWGPGPWQSEPDRVEFVHKGVPCLLRRHKMMGHWCGYAAVGREHPWYERRMEEEIDVHGGVTYGDTEAGDEYRLVGVKGMWWIGFDCAHLGDVSPGLDALTRSLSGPNPYRSEDTYKDIDAVRAETLHLAEQALIAAREKQS